MSAHCRSVLSTPAVNPRWGRALPTALIVNAAMISVEMACLLHNTAIVRHLDCVARHSVDGGIYLLEMTHPRSNFGVGSATESEWTAEADGLRKHTCCGAAGDSFEAVTQIDEVTVTMTWSGPSGQRPLVERARRRRITANEVDALVRADGQFEIIEPLGSLAQATPFTNELSAPFMVPVLRKRRAARPAALCN